MPGGYALEEAEAIGRPGSSTSVMSPRRRGRDLSGVKQAVGNDDPDNENESLLCVRKEAGLEIEYVETVSHQVWTKGYDPMWDARARSSIVVGSHGLF